MGFANYMAKEMMKEIGTKSREFFEFVLPPVEMHVDDSNLIVIIDIPGFEKKDIESPNVSVRNQLIDSILTSGPTELIDIFFLIIRQKRRSTRKFSTKRVEPSNPP